MGSPITMSGFNNIDFGSIITQMMAQERQPEIAFQQQQQNLKSQTANLSLLSTKLGALDTAAKALGTAGSLSGRSLTNSNTAAVSISAGASTPAGTYDIVVKELARAQVTATSANSPDANVTPVASAGSINIAGKVVTLTGDTTLQGLADAINGTSDIGVTASVVQADPTHYALVLTGTLTGQSNAFSITNNLSGGTGVAFGANSVDATDALITVNNVTVSSSTNTFSNAVLGTDLTVQKKDPLETITVTVNSDTAAGKQLVSNFVTAYNDLQSFQQNQTLSANNNDAGSLGHDAILRTISGALRDSLGGSNGADSSLQYLANVGIGFARTGELTFDSSAFDLAAAGTGLAHVQALFSGQGSTLGVFDNVHSSLSSFTASDGAIAAAQTSRTASIATATNQIASLESRLAIYEAGLRAQFSAADQAISALNGQTGSLSSLNSGYRLF